MSPDRQRRRPWGGTASGRSSATTIEADGTRPAAVDPVTVQLLATVAPCPLCSDGLCSRCWVVADVVRDLVVATRRDQAVDDMAVAA